MTSTATSPDGTTLAYDAWGSGPVVVLVGGALSTRQAGHGIAQRLADRGFTGVAYDRRGRGDSGDTAPYAVEREIEDVLAVAAAAGHTPPLLHGMSSGAALVLNVLASGADVAAASIMEPPYRLPDGPPLPPDYTGTLERLTAAGRHDEALTFFMTQAVGQPIEQVEQMKGMPMWAGMAALAPTLAYDGLCLGGDDQGLPESLLSRIDTPVLALASTGSPDWLCEPARQIADLLGSPFTRMAGDFHHVADDVLVDTIAPFFAES